MENQTADDTNQTTNDNDQTTNGRPTSAATIDHTEVHVDVTKKNHNSGFISTSDIDGGGVKYNTMDTGQTTIVVQTKADPKDKPKDFVVTSCMVIMFCNFCIGIPAWHYGLKANTAWQLGDEVESRMQAKRAKILVICGVVLGIVTWVLSLTLFFTVSPFRPGA